MTGTTTDASSDPARTAGDNRGRTPVDERSRDATILIVDDQEVNVRILERALGEAGYRDLHATTDPRSVAPRFDELQPDLILLDLHMPGLDGFGVMKELRSRLARHVYLPIVVLTADASPEVRLEALSTGATDFLTKPLDLQEVLLRIRNLLETRRLHLELRRQNRTLEERVRQRTAELEQSLAELRRTDETRRLLLSRVVTAQEEERRRIAGDIHDDSLQIVAAVAMRLEILRRRLSDPEEKAKIERLEETVRRAVARLRHLLFELRPPVLDREGLAPAVRLYLEERMDEEGQAHHLVNRFRSEPPAEIRTILYRLVQEALANVRKHARARNVEVVLDQDDAGYTVVVADDGAGFEPPDRLESAPGHLGLTALRERAALAGGRCRIESAPGHGTRVEFFIPAPPAAGAASDPLAV